MTSSTRPFCPYCLTAVIGSAILLGVPGLASVDTPFGSAGLLMLWLPTTCAVVRQAMRRIATAGASVA